MKIKVHYSLLILVALAFFAGFIQKVAILLTLILLHEVGHILACKFYKREINGFTILPFGAVINFENDKNVPIKEDFVIASAGLFVNFIILLAGFILPLSDDVVIFNRYLLIFNILPIWPLDGGRILELLWAKFLPFKKTIIFFPYFSLIIILLLLFWAIISLSGWNFMIMLSFLCIQNITSLKNCDNRFKQFLLKKYLYPNEDLEEKDVNLAKPTIVDNFFKGVNNVLRSEEKVKSEKTILERIFKK
ncbi:MAG: hypothetical protein FWE36_03715 [Erysipelotrichales bacterium]|nr:hypothetical protein [Erysipelotrichales bacterium]